MQHNNHKGKPAIFSRWLPFTKPTIRTGGDAEYRDILSRMNAIHDQIAHQQELFSRAIDEDLVDSSIYHILALEGEYRYWHRLARRCRGFERETVGAGN